MKKHHQGLLAFILVIFIGFLVGRAILTVFIFGAVMLLSLYVLVENIAPLKWMLSRTSKVFDVALFIFAVLATVQYGYNIAGGLTICGLGYSLYYGPKLRYERAEKKKFKKNHIPDGKSGLDFQ